MIRNPALSDSFREDLLTAACAFGTDISWFNRLPSWIRQTETFDALFHAYLRAGETGQAYLLLRNAGLFTGDKEALGSLTETLIGEDRIPYDQGRPDRFFTCLALYLFDRDAAGPKTLSYLAAVYEGPQEHMRALLTRLTETGTAPGDLPERLLVSMLFSGADSGLDELFLTYIHTCAYKDLIVRAFFTRRLAGYFLYENASPAPDIFAALYSYIHTSGDPESLPRLYLIALTKHYSERDRLMEEEQELCQKLTNILIRENLVFAYTKKLKKKISLPPEILDRYYIEYHGTAASAPRLLCRIGPEQETFREIPLRRVFESVYTAKLLLFLGDELHYMIYDGPEDDRPVQEGMLRVKKLHASGNDRSSCINRMVRSLDAGDFKQLEEDMLDYALRDEMRKELYTIEE